MTDEQRNVMCRNSVSRRGLLKAVTAFPGAALTLGGANRAKGGAPNLLPSPAAQPQEEYDPQQLNPYALKSIPDLGRLVPDKKFIWADLRGFDNTSPGFGAPGYLQDLNFKPDAIFILIAQADFVFLHDNLSTDATLEPRFSVYGGPELAGQTWTRFQLKGLVDHMHKAGVKVLLSLMTMVPRDRQGWAGQNLEVMTATSDGEILPAVNPLKRFKGGELFEDIFIANLRRTIRAYGFDGFQGADGFTHLRVPLQVADFSDDIVGQFLDYTKLELPTGLSKRSDGAAHAIKSRAHWILDQQRLAWVGFWRQRWAIFWTKLTEACKRSGKMVVANQPWTRDPYESIYRYGFDYRVLEEIGIDALVLETVAGPVQTGGYLGVGRPAETEAARLWLEDATSMVMCVKAYVPTLPLVFLLCVQDENEQWDTLRVAPDLLEKEIFSYAMTFYMNRAGKLVRCLDGFLVCLGVGVSRAEWIRVVQTTARAFSIASLDELKNLGVTAVWSDHAMENQLKHQLTPGAKWPKPPLHAFMTTFLREGGPVRAIVRSENLQKVQGPLLLVNPEFMADGEPARIEEWLSTENSSRSLMVVGEELRSFGSEVLVVRDYPEYGKLQCAIMAKSKDEQSRLRKELSRKLKRYVPETSDTPMILAIDKTGGTYFRVVETDPVSFLQFVSYMPVHRDFVLSAASALAVMANPGMTSDHGRISHVAKSRDATFVMVQNDDPEYLWCTVSVTKPIKKFTLVSSISPKRPIMHGGASFDIKVGPNGVAVMELGF